MDLERVLEMFERNYGLRSDDFYRAHLSNDSLATDLPVWHREVWAGTYRQLLTGRLAASGDAAAIVRTLPQGLTFASPPIVACYFEDPATVGVWRDVTDLASTTDNKQRVKNAVGAFFEFVNGDAGAFRMVFESDLRGEPAVQEAVDRATTASVDAITPLAGRLALPHFRSARRLCGDLQQ